MQVVKTLCLPELRVKCFIIGYLNLVACVVDIAFHVLIVAIVSNGFQCDVDQRSLQLVNWPSLEPLLLIVNMGSHGLYPFPLILRTNNAFVDYMPLRREPQCYPGMLHLYLIDIWNFLINVMWMKFVVNYISALHKKDPEPMQMFVSVSMVKLILQLLYMAYQPDFHNTVPVEAYWLIKVFDVCIAAFFLYLINKYTRILKMKKVAKEDQPPCYIDSLIAPTLITSNDEKKDKDVILSYISILDEKPIKLTEDKPNVI